MGSTVQEDSNVIQNMQCSTTVAAPVTTAVTLVTSPVTTTTPVGQPAITQPGFGQTTDGGVTNPGTVVTEPDIVVTFPSTTAVQDTGMPGQVGSTAAMSTSGGMMTQSTAPNLTGPPPPTEALDPAAPSPTTPAVTTAAVTTQAVTTPAVTTPAVTTPAATTLATSEQQRATCLIAIEADGELDFIFTKSNRLFSAKRSHLRRIGPSKCI